MCVSEFMIACRAHTLAVVCVCVCVLGGSVGGSGGVCV